MSLLVSCGGTVRAFTLDGREAPVPTDGNYDAALPTAARWYPNGRLLAVGLSSGVIAFHHHDQLEVIGNFNASSGADAPSAIQCIDVTAGSRFLAVGTENGELHIWDMKSSNIVNRFTANGPVMAVSFQHTTDSRYIACAAGSEVMVYSRASGRLVDAFTVASGKDSSTPDAKNGTGSPLPSASRAKVTAAAFSVHAVNLLAVTDDSGCVNVWDVSRTHASRAGSAVGSQRATKIGTDASYSRFTSPLRTPATDIAFTESTSSVGMLVAGLDKQIRVYDKMLRRFLFSIACSGPVASVAHCADDSHLAAGLTNGEIAIIKVNFYEKSSEVVATVPADPKSPGYASHSSRSMSVRSLHFQPLFSGQDIPHTPKVPKASASLDDLSSQAQYRTPAANQRARTSPSPALISGMLPPMPQRAADDNVLESTPRDSDIFSPMSRPVQNSRKFPLHTPERTPVRNMLPDNKLSEPSEQTLPGRFPMSIPVVMDRRMSDLIPSKSSAPPHSNFQDTSRANITSGRDGVLDGDAADSLLASSGRESFGTRGHQSGKLYASGRDEDAERMNHAPLPRGQAFRRLRKSASDVSPRKQLPPLHPRSHTASNLNGDAEDEVPQPEKYSAPSSAPPAVLAAPATAGNPHVSDDDAEFWTPKREQGQDMDNSVLSASPVRHNSGLPNGGQETQLAEIARVVKQTMVAEMDAMREDLRSDILNIHTELVLSSSNQVREIQKMFIERDRVIAELRKEVAELQKTNLRLQEMYIDE